MSEVLLFHHAQGLTKGVCAFADDLRASGHIVHTPDLFEDARSRISTRVSPTSVGSNTTKCGSAASASPTTCLPSSSTLGSHSECYRYRSLHRHGPEPAEPCSFTLACLSPASGASGPGRTASRSRSTGWTATRSSWARRHRRSPRDRAEGRGRGTFPVPRRSALLRRQLAPIL